MKFSTWKNESSGWSNRLWKWFAVYRHCAVLRISRQSRLLSSWATSPPASRARVTLWGIAEHFRAKTPPASVFEEEALPSQVTRTSDESWSNQPGAIATGQRSEPGCAGDRKGFRQRSPRLHGKRRIACTSAT